MPSIQPFRFLHTGDLHLDSPFEGVSSDAPAEVLQLLRWATTEAWRNVVRTAIREAVDFVVVAGDVFEHRSPTLLGQTRFRDGLAELATSGIDSFMVHGNHDPLDGRSWAPSLQFPARAHRFGTDAVESIPVTRDGIEIARVYGLSYDRPAVTANLAAGFRRESDAPFAIGLLHANVGDLPGHGNYAPCSVDDLRRSGMDYWALGHIHKPGVLLAGDPLAIYCGIPQGRDPGETGARGCYVVDVPASAKPSARFVACDVVRWQPLDVPIDGLADDEALQRRVREALAEAFEGADRRSLVVRLRLTGRGPLHTHLRRPGYLADLRQLLNEEISAAPPLLWVESLRDATQPAVDLDARRGAPDFVGDFLRVADAARRAERTTDPDEHARWLATLRAATAPLFDESQRGRRILRDARPSDERLFGELLDEAQALGVDLLLAAEEER
ncbi:MAG TPA: DNA repair exonuclease [Candidatus Limnocylindria bacterium]|nr:DNA repair exonuclease [Candidatus Limnocylindria bacterium]